MVVGYVRVSRDDNKKDYISIENQKLILTQYAKEHGYIIERWYEDDGISGYTFERPGFHALRMDLEKEIEIILAKDLSRIGRHNARVLLFLEEIRELGKRIILTDDSYDSNKEDEDILGIKTWYNERYVKDTSKKIRKAMNARQRAGTLAVNVPVGYLRNASDKSMLDIDEEAAVYIRNIFEYYLAGYGFRKIAEIFNEEGIPTPSLQEYRRMQAQGKSCKKKISFTWSPKMIGDIIKNDIYTGVMRYHKLERIAIHGKDRKVQLEKQYVFENHHPVIISAQTYTMAQQILQKRVKNSYRGMGKEPSKYCGFLYCKNCGSKMTAITREGSAKYYICGIYNSKGKQFCNQSYRIMETELDVIMKNYREYLIMNYEEEIRKTYQSLKDQQREVLHHNMEQLEKAHNQEKEELKLIMLQKIRCQLYENEEYNIWNAANETLQKEKLGKLKILKEQTLELQMKLNRWDVTLENPIKELYQLPVTRQELEGMIEYIEIADGSADVHLKDFIHPV